MLPPTIALDASACLVGTTEPPGEDIGLRRSAWILAYRKINCQDIEVILFHGIPC